MSGPMSTSMAPRLAPAAAGTVTSGPPSCRPDPFAVPSHETIEQLQMMRVLLNKKLGPEMLATRQGGGNTKLTYIEAWRVIALANEVFGFNGWFSEIKNLEVDFIDQCAETGRYTMGVSAIVKVWLRDGCCREDVGYGKAENLKSKAEALDKCKKEAVTDAMKRALRTFGNLLGNCIYDKHHVTEISKMKAPKPTLDFKNLYRGEAMYPEASASDTSTDAPAAFPPAPGSKLPEKKRPIPSFPPPKLPASKLTAQPMANDVRSRSCGDSTTAKPTPFLPERPLTNSETAFSDTMDDPLLEDVDFDVKAYDNCSSVDLSVDGPDQSEMTLPVALAVSPIMSQPPDVGPPASRTSVPAVDRHVSRPIRRSDIANGHQNYAEQLTTGRPATSSVISGNVGSTKDRISLGNFESARHLKRDIDVVDADDDEKENIQAKYFKNAAVPTGDRAPLGEIFPTDAGSGSATVKRPRAPPA